MGTGWRVVSGVAIRCFGLQWIMQEEAIETCGTVLCCLILYNPGVILKVSVVTLKQAAEDV